MQDYDKWRSQINGDVSDFFSMLQEEHRIPPMFSCLHLGGFCFANIIASYQRLEKEPPKELLNFMEKVFPMILKDQEEMISEQFLTLNTDGSA